MQDQESHHHHHHHHHGWWHSAKHSMKHSMEHWAEAAGLEDFEFKHVSSGGWALLALGAAALGVGLGSLVAWLVHRRCVLCMLCMAAARSTSSGAREERPAAACLHCGRCKEAPCSAACHAQAQGALCT